MEKTTVELNQNEVKLLLAIIQNQRYAVPDFPVVKEMYDKLVALVEAPKAEEPVVVQ